MTFDYVVVAYTLSAVLITSVLWGCVLNFIDWKLRERRIWKNVSRRLGEK